MDISMNFAEIMIVSFFCGTLLFIFVIKSESK